MKVKAIRLDREQLEKMLEALGISVEEAGLDEDTTTGPAIEAMQEREAACDNPACPVHGTSQCGFEISDAAFKAYLLEHVGAEHTAELVVRLCSCIYKMYLGFPRPFDNIASSGLNYAFEQVAKSSPPLEALMEIIMKETGQSAGGGQTRQ